VENGRGAARVLLAEDNIVNQRVAMMQIQKLGHRVDAVFNGREAVEALERADYDLVLMDCQMPVMDGYEATDEIRRREGQSRRIPIIGMTAHAIGGDRERCLEAGMDDYVTKPVRIEALGDAVERWAHARGAQTESDESLDPLMIAKLRRVEEEIGVGIVSEVIDAFLNLTPQRLADMQSALKDGDLMTFAEVALSLKGSCGYLGARRMEKLCSRLESEARDFSLDANHRFLTRLNEEFESVRPLLEVEKVMHRTMPGA
jgi:CheY-like chemotaxis protein